MKKPSVLILSDNSGWVVDRISEEFKANLSNQFDITVGYYTKLAPEKIYELSSKYDLIHYQNSDIGRVKNYLPLKCPIIMSVRSFRYPSVAKDAAKLVTKVHVINKDLLADFPGAVYIPDPLSNLFARRPFVVGMVAQDIPGNDDYKGVSLVREACDKAGAKLVVASNLPHEEMPAWYRSLDLFVCASKQEGFGHPIAEACAMNVPVISTSVGVARNLNVSMIDRSVESIVEAIVDYMADADCEEIHALHWAALKKKYIKLYENAISS